MTNNRVLIGQKAANTRRLNKLSQSNLEAVKQLTTQIIDLQFSIDDDISRQSIIAKEINKTTWASFCRFGSKNYAASILIPYWISTSGVPLDAQAYWMNETYYTQIEPHELVDFMLHNSRGKNMVPQFQQLEQLKNLFRQVAGFTWNIKFAKKHILSKEKSTEDYF